MAHVCIPRATRVLFGGFGFENEVGGITRVAGALPLVSTDESAFGPDLVSHQSITYLEEDRF
jgi:hypothetical protein